MGKRVISPIKKGRIQLRLLAESDLMMTLAWRNQEHIRKWFIHPDIISPEQHRKWFEEYVERDNDFLFIIEETQNLGKPVGQISLYNIDWSENRGEFGRLLIGDPEGIGRGLAKEATRAALQLAFETFRLQEVFLQVFRHNVTAIAFYQGCGFRSGDERNGLLLMKLLRPNPEGKKKFGVCLG